MKKLKNFLKKNFITGLLVLVPLGVTIFVLKGLLGWIDNILGDIPGEVIGLRFPGLGIITLILFILIVGMSYLEWRRRVARRKDEGYGDAATLVLPRAREVLTGQPAESVIEALVGVERDPGRRGHL